MSLSYREQSNAAKAVRAGIVDGRLVAGRSSKPCPVVIEYRMVTKSLLGKGWHKLGAYRNDDVANRAISNHQRKWAALKCECVYRRKEAP